MSTDRKKHWETVYETKTPEQVSWTQEKPVTSLDEIRSFGLGTSASIIDIGGGDSNLVDFLLEEGYENITVLDISKASLERAKKRLGEKANKVTWIETDITEFQPTQSYDIWHDRAAFHFLTQPNEIEQYVSTVNKYVSKNMIIGTFSNNGPKKCSGLNISQYTKQSLTSLFNSEFQCINCRIEDHKTPFDTIQNFIFCSFTRTNTLT